MSYQPPRLTTGARLNRGGETLAMIADRGEFWLHRVPVYQQSWTNEFLRAGWVEWSSEPFCGMKRRHVRITPAGSAVLAETLRTIQSRRLDGYTQAAELVASEREGGL